MEVVREGVWKLAFDLDESGTPEEVGSIVGSCCIFDRDLVGRMEILAEGKIGGV